MFFLADYGSAIETLVTAISLIKQSKVSADDRCKVLISSLQDCLHGIESKSYGSASRSALLFLCCIKRFHTESVFDHASFPSEESVPESETTVVPEKRADVISLVAGTDTKTITGNAAEKGTATARETVTEIARETGKGNIATAR